MLTKGNWARAGVHWLYRKMIAERFPRIALIKCHYWLLGSPPCKLARAWTQRHTHSLTKLLLLLYTSTSIYICVSKDKNPRKHSSNIFPSSSSTRTRLLVISTSNIQRLCAVIDFQEELMRAHKVKPSFFSFLRSAPFHFISSLSVFTSRHHFAFIFISDCDLQLNAAHSKALRSYFSIPQWVGSSRDISSLFARQTRWASL